MNGQEDNNSVTEWQIEREDISQVTEAKTIRAYFVG